MNYTILVTGAPYGTQNASTAFLFCKALVNTVHHLKSIFFYCDGVLNANSMTTPANDEFDLIKAWQKLKKKHSINLYVCNSAAMRRGVIAEKKILNLDTQNGNLAIFFELSGLIELACAIKKCDRLIQF
jgi:tRNA 2-thiouridine synthesizing protein D